MRVVGGKMKGRALRGPASNAIRPTSDRLRETIFNILRHSYDDPVDGAHVLDLFAGTGAMAIEALSRGARSATLIDTSAEANAIIRANIEGLGLSASARVLRRAAERLGSASPGEPFNLVFLDPPYGKGLVPSALVSLRDGSWLAKDALVVVEEAEDTEIVLAEGFCLLEARRYGDTKILFLRAP